MQRNYNSLKRGAPGTTPSVPQNPQSYPVQDAQQLQNQTDPQFYDWNQPDFKPPTDLNGFDVTDFASNAYAPGVVGNGQVPNQTSLASGTGELVKRNANQQLARQTRNGWDVAAGENTGPGWVYDDDEVLSRKALEAKREAQTKKRQIPPFVLKLSRYVSKYFHIFVYILIDLASLTSLEIPN
jgi:heat shock transcription factor